MNNEGGLTGRFVRPSSRVRSAISESTIATLAFADMVDAIGNEVLKVLTIQVEMRRKKGEYQRYIGLGKRRCVTQNSPSASMLKLLRPVTSLWLVLLVLLFLLFLLANQSDLLKSFHIHCLIVCYVTAVH